jgi:2-dehydro-3-deoxyphosphogluconate aldolase/(4S)-4-hydroxy-2-oxoglutarate aldolase
MDMIETLGKAGIIPVIVIEDSQQAVPLARALVAGGLPVLEVTFRTEAAAGAIAAIRREVPEAVVGAGTVLSVEQLEKAKAAGAAFCVAPGFDPAIVAAAAAAGMPFCPGIATASELSQALSAGCKMVKFFPAEAAGGVSMIKNLLGAFRFTGANLTQKYYNNSITSFFNFGKWFITILHRISGDRLS